MGSCAFYKFVFIITMSRTEQRRYLEPLDGCIVGLGNEVKRHYLNLFRTMCLLRGFSISTCLFASVLRTILRTLDSGCAEVKLFTLNQGGRVPEIAKSRDKQLKRNDDVRAPDSFRGLINKALAPVMNWDYASRRLRPDRYYSYHHLFRSPCIV